MKCIYWNARGLANHPTKLAHKKFYELHKPDFIFIAEPWMAKENFPESVWRKLNMKCFAVNDRSSMLPNLWCICSVNLDPSIMVLTDQFVAFSVMIENQKIYIAAIYASTSYLVRRKLWQDLNLIQHNYWCFIGDFNVVLGAHEYRGKGLPLQIASNDFRLWTDCNALTHILTRGAFYSWSNGRRGREFTEKRLDRAVCNDEWLNFWTSVSCCTLTKSASDHFPIL